jgi:endo-1,4-beta-xylanase
MKFAAILSAAAVASAVPLAEPEEVFSRQATESIHAAMVAKGKQYFGTCTDQGRFSNAKNAAIIKENFGQITAENR